jgi:hypothetical protein
MAREPTLDFDSRAGVTIANIGVLYAQRGEFFRQRGVTSAADLAAIIEWRFPLQALPFKNGNRRRIRFSNGFTANRVEKVLSGYSVTACGSTPRRAIFGPEAPLGVAFLFGMAAEHVPARNILDSLKGVANELHEGGLWSLGAASEGAPFREAGLNCAALCLNSYDRVIAYLEDVRLKHVRYLYVKTQFVGSEREALLQNLDDYGTKELIEGRISRVAQQFFSEITGGDEFVFQKVWCAFFNDTVRTAQDYTCYVNCFNNENERGAVVLRRPTDGFCFVAVDNDPFREEYLQALSYKDQLPYLEALSHAQYSALDLGYFYPSATNYTAKPLDSNIANGTVLSEMTLRFRQQHFNYSQAAETSVVANTNALLAFEHTLMYTPLGIAAPITMKPSTVLLQYPLRDMGSSLISDEDFINLHMRMRCARMLVRKTDLRRIVYLLQRILDSTKDGEARYDFSVCEDDKRFLVFLTALFEDREEEMQQDE